MAMPTVFALQFAGVVAPIRPLAPAAFFALLAVGVGDLALRVDLPFFADAKVIMDANAESSLLGVAEHDGAEGRARSISNTINRPEATFTAPKSCAIP